MPLLKDAREAVDRLIEGGVPEGQANAIVDLFVDADEQVATRSDIEQLSNRIDEVEERLNQRIDEVEDRLGQRIEENRAHYDQQWTTISRWRGRRSG